MHGQCIGKNRPKSNKFDNLQGHDIFSKGDTTGYCDCVNCRGSI